MNYFRNVFLALISFTFLLNTNAQIPDKAEDISPLLIGETLPKSTLQYNDGTAVALSKLLDKKPTVLVFYRGGWCPYCNAQLAGLAKVEKEILELGFQIVAISPDDYQNLKSTEEKDSINYTLLSDKNGEFIREIGIAFTTPAMMKGYIATKEHKGKTSEVMPAPTVMIVDQKGKILFEYINPNYKERLSEQMLIAVLQSLRE